jgi:hypothetical protein
LRANQVRKSGAGYIKISKGFRGKFPLTLGRIADEGRRGFESYRKTMRKTLRA